MAKNSLSKNRKSIAWQPKVKESLLVFQERQFSSECSSECHQIKNIAFSPKYSFFQTFALDTKKKFWHHFHNFHAKVLKSFCLKSDKISICGFEIAFKKIRQKRPKCFHSISQKYLKNTILPKNIVIVLFLTQTRKFLEPCRKTGAKSQHFLAQCPKNMNTRTFLTKFFSLETINPPPHVKCFFENLLQKAARRPKRFCLVPRFKKKIKKFSKKQLINQRLPLET